LYDRFGAEGMKEQGVGFGGNPMDIFEAFFGEGIFGKRPSGGQRKGEDLRHLIKVTLEDLFNGLNHKLSVRKTVLCPLCEGKGTNNPNVKGTFCNVCQGSGVNIVYRKVGFGMVQQARVVCSSCKGLGKIIKEKDLCKKCYGDKVTEVAKLLDVFVEKGMEHGQKIVFREEADQEPGIIAGDVVVVLQQQPHSRFTRQGSDLIITKEISLLEALTGFEFIVKHLGDHSLRVKSKEAEIIKPGDVKVVLNEGMPQWKNPFTKGNLIIKFEVKFPVAADISPKVAQELKNIFPKPVVAEVPQGEAVYDVKAQEFTEPTSNSSQSNYNNYYESDSSGDEGEVGCAHQ